MALGTPQRDPLGSPNWQDLSASLLGEGDIRFDDRLRVTMPIIAENQHMFPVSVDARALGDVRRLALIADLNPIPLAIDMQPRPGRAFVETRIKLDQRTPVRGAAQLADGTWIVSGNWIDAAGGGCSAAPVSRVRGDWAEHLGEIRGLGVAEGEGARLRLAFRHPMDTGFVANIPTYHLETLTVANDRKETLATLEISAAVSEDPAFSLFVDAKAGERLTIAARDTNGLDYRAALVVGAAR